MARHKKSVKFGRETGQLETSAKAFFDKANRGRGKGRRSRKR